MNRARKGMENPRSIMPEELPKLTSNNTALVPPQLKKDPERYQKIAGRCPMTMDPSDVSL
jgi:hypothetical protein